MRWFLFFAGLMCLPVSAAAGDRPACTGRNLLRGARVIGAVMVEGDPGRVLDGELTPEGAPWRGPQAAVLGSPEARLTLDLGQTRPVSHLLVQADANDVYLLEGSLDGRRWSPVWRVPSLEPLEGTRSRLARLSAARPVRYLRLSVARGDGRYSVAEVRAYCRQPRQWPPPSLAAMAPLTLGTDRGAPALLTADRAQKAKIAVAVLAALLLLWGVARRKLGVSSTPAGARIRKGLLVGLGLTAAACWYNGGKFHFDEYVHTREVYHYYMGAKYFPELSYTRLYDCSVVADQEAGLGAAAGRRVIRDLRTNKLGSAAGLAREPARCKAHFSAARWRAFSADVSWFRRQMTLSRWEDAQQDHGYNATPLWGVMGRLLASTGPASDGQILALALLDPLLLCAMFAAVWWAFGWRALCLTLIFWGTNYPARFFWNGGGFLRQAWLVLSIVSICLMRRQRMFGAGIAITAAALLRVFPGLLVTGLVLNALWRMWRRRRMTLSPAHRRFALGCVAALLVLVPLSAAYNGAAAWPGFVDNSRKHLATPLTNYMGLKTVVAFSPATRASQIKDSAGLDPYGPWKEARRDVFSARKPLFLLLVLGYLVLLFRAVRGRPDWYAATVSIGLIPVATELTCYYMSILLGLALLHRRSPLVVAGLLAYSAATWACADAWGWYDEQFTWLSLLTVCMVFCSTWWLGRRPSTPLAVSRLLDPRQAPVVAAPGAAAQDITRPPLRPARSRCA